MAAGRVELDGDGVTTKEEKAGILSQLKISLYFIFYAYCNRRRVVSS
jgi:hypothetical protein